jgi:hypothetical protein
MAVHVPCSKEGFLLQIYSSKMGQKKNYKGPSLFLCLCPIIIFNDKKTELLSCFCLIHLLQLKDHTKDRVFCRASVSYICYDKKKEQKTINLGIIKVWITTIYGKWQI